MEVVLLLRHLNLKSQQSHSSIFSWRPRDYLLINILTRIPCVMFYYFKSLELSYATTHAAIETTICLCRTALVFLNESNKAKLENLIHDLFTHDGIDFTNDMSEFSKTLFAVLIMSFESMLAVHGPSNIILVELHSTAVKYQIDLDTLKQWSRAVKSDWTIRNSLNTDSSVESLEAMRGEIIQLKQTNSLMLEELTQLKGQSAWQFVQMQSLLTQLISAVQTVLLSNPKMRSPLSGSKRTRQEAAIEDAAAVEDEQQHSAEQEEAPPLAALVAAVSSAVQPVGQVNPFFLVANRSMVPPARGTAKGVTLKDVFIKDVKGESSQLSGDAYTRANTCLEFMKAQLSDEDKSFLRGARASHETSAYLPWNTQLGRLASEVQLRAMKKLLTLEGKSPDAKSKALPTLEAVAKRLSRSKKSDWMPTPQSQLLITTLF